MRTATRTLLPLLFFLFCHAAKAQRYSVILHELMIDPQPAVGLPDAEYVELKNRGGAAISLKNWRLQTGTSTSGPFPDYLLQPDSFVVITSRTNSALFAVPVLGIASFPALANNGATVMLLNDTGAVVHAVAYTKSWYGDDAKADGGWSLEMIDAANPCAGATNWKAAIAAAGGTPGSVNSVQQHGEDDMPPALLSAVVEDSATLVLRFDEPVQINSNNLQNIFRLQPAVSVQSATLLPPLFDRVKVVLQQPLYSTTVYTVTVNNAADCAGNVIGIYNQTSTGIPHAAAAGDVVINEILFNPKPDGTDYVELYNRSDKVIDVSTFRTKSNSNTIYKISDEALYLLPKSYAVLTENRDAVLHQYLVKENRLLWAVDNLPSLPDDEGTFVLRDANGTVIDSLHYKDDWHHALIADAEGVALERLDAAASTNDRSNWLSAAATAGFATPGYQNSQRTSVVNTSAAMNILPKAFSPNGDGFEDFCAITFETSASGWVANLRLFDAAGKEVRYLVRNETLSVNNQWLWDGQGEGGKVLPSGAYVVWLEAFNVKGDKRLFKKVVALSMK